MEGRGAETRSPGLGEGVGTEFSLVSGGNSQWEAGGVACCEKT